MMTFCTNSYSFPVQHFIPSLPTISKAGYPHTEHTLLHFICTDDDAYIRVLNLTLGPLSNQSSS